MSSYLCKVCYAFGDDDGSWMSIPVCVYLDEPLDSASESVLLQKAREKADDNIDERMYDHIAHVWLGSYEWIESGEEKRAG